MVKKYKKIRPPRLYSDEKGRYIKIKNKKVYIKSQINNKQLVNVIVNNFKRHKRKQKDKKPVKKGLLSPLEQAALSGYSQKQSDPDLAKLMFYLTLNKKEDENRKALLSPKLDDENGDLHKRITQQERQLIRQNDFIQGLPEAYMDGGVVSYIHPQHKEHFIEKYHGLKQLGDEERNKALKSDRDAEDARIKADKMAKDAEDARIKADKLAKDAADKLEKTKKEAAEKLEKSKKEAADKLKKAEEDRRKQLYEQVKKDYNSIVKQIDEANSKKEEYIKKRAETDQHRNLVKSYVDEYNTLNKIKTKNRSKEIKERINFLRKYATQKITVKDQSGNNRIKENPNHHITLISKDISDIESIDKNLEEINNTLSDLTKKKQQVEKAYPSIDNPNLSIDVPIDTSEQDIQQYYSPTASDIEPFLVVTNEGQKVLDKINSGEEFNLVTPLPSPISKIKSDQNKLDQPNLPESEKNKILQEIDLNIYNYATESQKRQLLESPYVSPFSTPDVSPKSKRSQSPVVRSKIYREKLAEDISEADKNKINENLDKLYHDISIDSEKERLNDPTVSEYDKNVIKKRIESYQQQYPKSGDIDFYKSKLYSLSNDLDKQDISESEKLHIKNEIEKYKQLLAEEERQQASGKKDGGLYDDQIENVMDQYKKEGFKGVYAIDEISKIPVSDKMGVVLNLDKSNQPGSHWVALYIDADDDQSVEYYDSYGEDPPESLMKDLKELVNKINPSTYLKFKVNKIKQQSETSDNCGVFAMKFLMDRFKGIPFKECSGYSDVARSEKNAEKLKKRLKSFGYI